MDSQAVISRFEQERQALAEMDHSNVCRVFEGGSARRSHEQVHGAARRPSPTRRRIPCDEPREHDPRIEGWSRGGNLDFRPGLSKLMEHVAARCEA